MDTFFFFALALAIALTHTLTLSHNVYTLSRSLVDLSLLRLRERQAGGKESRKGKEGGGTFGHEIGKKYQLISRNLKIEMLHQSSPSPAPGPKFCFRTLPYRLSRTQTHTRNQPPSSHLLSAPIFFPRRIYCGAHMIIPTNIYA